MIISTSCSSLTPQDQAAFMAYLEQKEKALRKAVALDAAKKKTKMHASRDIQISRCMGKKKTAAK